MKKSLVLCAALLLVSGMSWGSTYTWGGSVGGNGSWIVPGNWVPGTSVAGPTKADDAIVSSGTAGLVVGGTTTVGSLLITGTGTIKGEPGAYTLTVDNAATGGTTGDLVYRTSSQWVDGTSGWTWNIGGNLLLNNTGNVFAGVGKGTLNLSGVNKGIFHNVSALNNILRTDIIGSYYDNASKWPLENNVSNMVIVESQGKIIAPPGGVATSLWRARNFVFKGGQANLPSLGDCVDFWYSNDARADNNASYNPSQNSACQHLAVAGGVIYPRDVVVGPVNGQNYQTNSAAPRLNYNWTFTRSPSDCAIDTTIGRDLLIGDTPNSYVTNGGREFGSHWLNLVENNTTNAVSLTVNRDFTVGTAQKSTSDTWGVRLYGSTLRVQGSILCGGNTSEIRNPDVMTGAMVMGNATLGLNARIYVGQNFMVRYPSAWVIANWDPAGSTVTMGNGTSNGRTQLLRTQGEYGIALNDLIIDSPGNKVNLDNTGAYYSGGNHQDPHSGDLLLHGDLIIKRGAFNSPSSHNSITFNGPEHLLMDNTSGGAPHTNFDDIILLDGAVVNLGSDILITSPGENKPGHDDNLIMGAGSTLYLNGFKLWADGKLYDGSVAGEWANDGGTIIGAAIPEPATLLMLGTGALGAFGWLRRRRMR